jgi:hypothetical protein
MRAIHAIFAVALLAMPGCGPAPDDEVDPELLRLLGDAGPIEPTSARDCGAMIQIARQVFHYGPNVVAPRLSGESYRNCEWAKAGITFEPETPDNRFIWVGFSGVQKDQSGVHIDAYRSNDGDGLQHTRCDLQSSGDTWRLSKCADMGVIMQQGQ